MLPDPWEKTDTTVRALVSSCSYGSSGKNENEMGKEKVPPGHRLHYTSLEDLIAKHGDIFANEAKFDLWGESTTCVQCSNKHE